MPYAVEFTSSARREFLRLPKQAQTRLAAPMHRLMDDPRPHGVRKLEGEQFAYRIRVGRYRVLYDILDEQQIVVITKVVRRAESTYR